MPDFTLTIPADDGELTAYQDIVAQALHFPRELAERYVRIVGSENFRIVRLGNQIAGGLAVLPMGHFLGGKSVAVWGIAALGIAAEHRAGIVRSPLEPVNLRRHR